MGWDSGEKSAFAKGEVTQILLAWLVLSIALSLSYFEGLFKGSGDISYIFAALIATATGFICHEMGHKFVAMRLGYVAHFRIWIWGIVLTIITAAVSQGTFIFGAPGAVYIAPAAATGYYAYEYSIEREKEEKRKSMLVSVAGPGMNLAFAVFFLLLIFISPTSGFLSVVAMYGFILNVGLGSFNMLPIPPLDGFKIFRGNIFIALAVALPLWGMLLYFFYLG